MRVCSHCGIIPVPDKWGSVCAACWITARTLYSSEAHTADCPCWMGVFHVRYADPYFMPVAERLSEAEDLQAGHVGERDSGNDAGTGSGSGNQIGTA